MDAVRRAEPERLLAPRLDRVDDDDRLGACDACALDDELADAAGADHERDAARLGAGREQHGADAGQRRAAEQRRIAQRHGAAESGSATWEETTTRSAHAPVAVPR